MKIEINKKYLTFPVNIQTVSKKVCFFEEDELIFDFDCKIDMRCPNFTAYVDVERFMGKTFDVTISPDMAVDIGMTNEIDMTCYGKEELRPKVHFTVLNGWNNDPNGLIKYNGRYHMFYQYNPCSTEWANMHWGHAVSSDLLHWEHKDVALFPDKNGTMYSGCAIEDVNNVSCISKLADKPMLVYYTAAGGKNKLSVNKYYDQWLAYSIDNGETLIKYGDKPLIPTIDKGNRDPKVVWVEELNKYIIALYMIGHKYSFFTSTDLVTWTHFCDVEIDEEAECPDIFSFEVNEEKLWVLMGASDIYVVGKFTENEFVVLQQPKRLTYSRVNYAAQSFSGIDDGRVVRVSWQRISIPNSRFSQQMSIPTEMGLEKQGEEYLLTALPIRELQTLYDKQFKHDGKITNKALRFEVGENPIDVKLEFKNTDSAPYTIMVFGMPLTVNFSESFIQFKGTKMPFVKSGDLLDIRFIADRCTLEVFACSGKCNFAEFNIWDYNLPYIEFPANRSIENIKIECNTLKSIYEND